MLDNKGWRKKIHSKPKDLPPLKGGGDDTATAEDPSDRRRHHGWRKTIQGSRPGTPGSRAPTTPATDDADDSRSTRSETSTPRRNSKPKLARYTSLFSNSKEASKRPEFTEPWGEDAPPTFPSYVDPLISLQSIRSLMVGSPSKPIPLEHNNGLFRIFEDYRKVREMKEHLETLSLDIFQDWRKAQEQWSESELRYEAEIRRLDLLIAQGTSGMTELMKVRQGSVVDRKRRHRKTISNGTLPTMYEFLSREQLDNEIKLRSQRVLLHRPTSPSGKMATLSKQFGGKDIELPIGDPPEEGREMTLSRKVQSELNLASLSRMEATQSITSSVISGFSGSTGDPLPDETTAPTPAALMESAVKCDAFIALRELGALVARRRGLRVDNFINGLMVLFSNTNGVDASTERAEEQGAQLEPLKYDPSGSGKPHTHENLTPRRIMRRYQSQPQLNSDQKRLRHFSFEPGDDQLRALEEEFRAFEAERRDSDSSDSFTPPLARIHNLTLESGSTNSTPSLQTLSSDFQRPSKIPSPVQTLGRVRRENSASSLQSIFVRPNDDRRDSRSSILTAFRENSSGSLGTGSKSRSSSIHNLRAVASSLPLKDRSGSNRTRNSVVARAAARAADNGNQTPMARDVSLARSSARPSRSRSYSRATGSANPLESEDDDDKERSLPR